MKRILALSVAAILAASASAWAQEGGLSREAMQAAMLKAARPGAQHQQLAKLAGNYTYTAKAWMEPGGDPQEWSGNRTASMILGGRFLDESIDGSFLGMPFEGRGLWAYDNMAGEYVLTWCDNMGTTITIARGSESESGMELKGTHMVPGLNVENSFKTVVRTIDDDSFVFEWYESMPGQDEMFKMMEITYKRK